MGMKMMLEQFQEQRRQDPKRGAEARVFDALQNLDLDGHGLYEYRYRREGKQVDYPLWIHSMARFAVQVKGGKYEMDNTGQWFLHKPDGKLDRVQSPLEETADGCMEMRDGILEVTGYKNFIAGVLIFPDMERDEKMEHMADARPARTGTQNRSVSSVQAHSLLSQEAGSGPADQVTAAPRPRTAKRRRGIHKFRKASPGTPPRLQAGTGPKRADLRISNLRRGRTPRTNRLAPGPDSRPDGGATGPNPRPGRGKDEPARGNRGGPGVRAVFRAAPAGCRMEQGGRT